MAQAIYLRPCEVDIRPCEMVLYRSANTFRQALEAFQRMHDLAGSTMTIDRIVTQRAQQRLRLTGMMELQIVTYAEHGPDRLRALYWRDFEKVRRERRSKTDVSRAWCSAN